VNKEPVETRLKNLETLVKSQESQIKALENQVRVLRDIEDIEKLQKAYGYYLEHWMVEEVVDCFSDRPDVALYWLEGTWLGKEGVRRYFTKVENPDPRTLHQMMQLCGVIDVDPNGHKAKGRWYGFGAWFVPRSNGIDRSIASGIYESEYVKENGIWKILSFKWLTPYLVKISEDSWGAPEQFAANIPLASSIKGEPDIPLNQSDMRYLSGYVFPFHYKHPVTGRETSEGKYNAKLQGSQSK
jgi:hypothetical protein